MYIFYRYEFVYSTVQRLLTFVQSNQSRTPNPSTFYFQEWKLKAASFTENIKAVDRLLTKIDGPNRSINYEVKHMTFHWPCLTKKVRKNSTHKKIIKSWSCHALRSWLCHFYPPPSQIQPYLSEIRHALHICARFIRLECYNKPVFDSSRLQASKWKGFRIVELYLECEPCVQQNVNLSVLWIHTRPPRQIDPEDKTDAVYEPKDPEPWVFHGGFGAELQVLWGLGPCGC